MREQCFLVHNKSVSPAKVVMLTALGQQEVLLQAIRAGAKDFLVKPLDPERMIKVLQKVLREN